MRHAYHLSVLFGLAAALVFLPCQAFASAIVSTICQAYTLIGTNAGRAIMTLAVMGLGFGALAAGKLNLPMCLVILIGGVLLLSPCQFVAVITGGASPCSCAGIGGSGGSGPGAPPVPGVPPAPAGPCPPAVCPPAGPTPTGPFVPTPE